MKTIRNKNSASKYDVVVIGNGGRAHALKAKVIDKREFAGYWEYVLDEALFAAPAHPQWGGSALIGPHGRLIGVGSLLVEEKHGEQNMQGNMFVPIDLLEPILEAGGLADSVSEQTGFIFDQPTPQALWAALARALETWRKPSAWRAMQQNGMRRDFGWGVPARAYLELYRRALS